MTNREIATVALLAALAAWVLATPKARKSLPAVVRAMVAPRLLGLWIGYFAYSAALLVVGARLGVWRLDMAKDTAITVIGVGLPMLMSASDLRNGPQLLRRTAARTVGAAALVAAYVNLAAFSIPVEMVVQVVTAVLVMMQLVAQRMPNGAAVHRLVTGVIAVLGVVYLWRTTAHVVAEWHTEDWEVIWRVFAMSVWFPALLIPFVYSVAFVMETEVVLKMLPFFNSRKKPPVRVRLAIVLGLRLSIRYASGFAGPWRSRLARVEGFREARRLMGEYRRIVSLPTEEGAATAKR